MAGQDKSGRLVIAGGICILLIFVALIFAVNNWLKHSLQEMQGRTAKSPAGAISPPAASQKNIRSAAIKARVNVEKPSAAVVKSDKPKNQNIQRESPLLSKVLNE